jgi:hypothetical protein
LPFIGIAIDTREAAQAYLRQHPASYPLALASPALLPTFDNQINDLPYTVILTSQYRICTRPPARAPESMRLARLSSARHMAGLQSRPLNLSEGGNENK